MINSIIKIPGREGEWLVKAEISKYDAYCYLLESLNLGGNEPSLLIKKDGSIILDNVQNGIDEVFQYLVLNPYKLY